MGGCIKAILVNTLPENSVNSFLQNCLRTVKGEVGASKHVSKRIVSYFSDCAAEDKNITVKCIGRNY